MSNPLLDFNNLPAFGRISPELVEPAIDQLLQESRSTLKSLLQRHTVFTWDNLLAPMEEQENRLDRAWSPVAHLHSVADSEPLRAAYNACLPKLTDYATEIGQHEGLYQACRQIAAADDFRQLHPAQRKIVENMLRDFRLSGADLDAPKRTRFREIQLRLSQLQTRFEENLLDATRSWKMHVTDPTQVSGLPESALALARAASRDAGKDGWLFTLEFPSYLPVMQYADDRALRRAMYEAYVCRASSRGPAAGAWDNGPLMVEVLALRRELAALLGYPTFADLSLVRKMAGSVAEVMRFLEQLARRARPMAVAELEELRAFSAGHHGMTRIDAWDIAYYSEKLRQHRYSVSHEELRPYFPVPRVVEGMFEIVRLLFGISIVERRGVDVWDPEVRFFDIRGETGELRGGFYLDLYARPNKRNGAWMDDCAVRRRHDGDLQLPIAYLTCNFPRPLGADPSLLTHDDVMTLFHEFGHGLHHMLTQIDYAGVSGINGVPWDAAELPSQFLENWCWERDALKLISCHYRSGESLPEDLFQRLLKARNFQSGMQMVRQLEFALFDFRLHSESQFESETDIQTLLDEVRSQVAVVMPPDYNRFQNSFSHIFAGGYAAGYYGYKWAEVLSADAFSRFEENGIFDQATGRQFLHSILEQGGSKDPMDMFIEFRGRRPSMEALLRHAGIAPLEDGAVA